MYTSFLASQFCVRIQSAAIVKSLRKAHLQKQEWILPLSILLPKTRFLHRPSSSKKQTTSANNTSIPPAIYPENHICKELSEDPEKTNIGTVKMMEAKCEVIVIILIDKSGYYLQGCWCCFSISYWVLSSFLLKKQRNKSFLIISMKRRKKESRHSFGKESTIWQWLKAEGTKNVSSARTTIFWTQHSTLSECRKQSNI